MAPINTKTEKSYTMPSTTVDVITAVSSRMLVSVEAMAKRMYDGAGSSYLNFIMRCALGYSDFDTCVVLVCKEAGTMIAQWALGG